MEGPANGHRFDDAAIGMSGLCVLHCTALPLLATGMPWMTALGLVDDGFHQLMLLLAVPVSGLALAWGWRRTRRLPAPVIGVVGLTIMAFAGFEMHPVVTATLERDLTLLGAGLLTLAHGINLRNWWRGRMSQHGTAPATTVEGGQP